MNMHETYMRIAVRLAMRAEGLTSPNPVVGSVVVNGGKIVGKGYHKKCGSPHAEVIALMQAKERSKGAILYVTLEPCDHYGKTPPCTELIKERKIKKVVIGMVDPNPINNGRGIKKLNRYGIATEVGILEDEVKAINKPYIKFIKAKLPYVTIKAAESIDGKIATKSGKSKWITSGDSRLYVHKLRCKVDAVMVGVNTVIKDDPFLLSAVPFSKQPVRIIIDSRLRTPMNAKIFSKLDISPVIIATIDKSRRLKRYEAIGAKVICTKPKGGKVDLRGLLKVLARRGIVHILVEGGGELNAALLKEGLADRALFFIAPKIIGGRDAITSVEGDGVDSVDKAALLKNINIRRFAKDILVEGDIA